MSRPPQPVALSVQEQQAREAYARTLPPGARLLTDAEAEQAMWDAFEEIEREDAEADAADAQVSLEELFGPEHADDAPIVPVNPAASSNRRQRPSEATAHSKRRCR